MGCRAAAIHGDMDQHSRMAVLHDFKAGKHHVLVATDVAARGLDIKSIKSVVNYDAAKEVDTHVHRIGRTGRAGDKEGVAYTLITPYETRFAGQFAIIRGFRIAMLVSRLVFQACLFWRQQQVGATYMPINSA